MPLRSNFSSFPQNAQYISNFGSQMTYSFLRFGCSIYFFLNSANLICRGTDISKYFRESLGFRDNERRLYHIGRLISSQHRWTCATHVVPKYRHHRWNTDNRKLYSRPLKSTNSGTDPVVLSKTKCNVSRYELHRTHFMTILLFYHNALD